MCHEGSVDRYSYKTSSTTRLGSSGKPPEMICANPVFAYLFVLFPQLTRLFLCRGSVLKAVDFSQQTWVAGL